ncbi:DUF4189 domain-containing protein [Falsiroseomonas ponticola]|uniref:DUF4189 domain-containing protein n=1 Tax=Falsiroseomonas ponticola TaxID=2786951 RepID=UPI0019327302|nr:DUF4189 domain-containing protein [Roseomonas ponticola]
MGLIRTAVLALGALLALGAPEALAQTGNPTNDALLARNEAGRREAFRSLLTQNRYACAEVTVLFQAGLDPRRTAYWDLSCRDGGPWRIAIPAERWATPTLNACGQGTGPAAGPCFRGLSTSAPGLTAAVAAPPPSCRTACDSQPQSLQNACLARCASGSTIQAAAPAGATAAAVRGRFGFIYTAEPPSTAFGFSSGKTDRLAANMDAIRACEAVAGRNQCRVALDFPNACGALVQALTTPPVQVRRLASGVGQTREQAEAQALNTCRLAEAASSSITCRIAMSGC